MREKRDVYEQSLLWKSTALSLHCDAGHLRSNSFRYFHVLTDSYFISITFWAFSQQFNWYPHTYYPEITLIEAADNNCTYYLTILWAGPSIKLICCLHQGLGPSDMIISKTKKASNLLIIGDNCLTYFTLEYWVYF